MADNGGGHNSGLIQKVFIGVIAAVFSMLATLAVGGTHTVSRDEVGAMIHESESRYEAQVGEIRTDQKAMAADIKGMSLELAKLSVQIERLLK